MSQTAATRILIVLVIISLAGFGFAAAKVIGLSGEVDSLTDRVASLQKKLPKPAVPQPAAPSTGTVADEKIEVEPTAGTSNADYDELMRHWRELSAKVDELSKRQGAGATSTGGGSSSETTTTAGAGGETTATATISLLSTMTPEEKEKFKATVKEAVEEMEREEREARMNEMAKRILDDLATRLDLQPQQREAVGALMNQQMEAVQKLWRSDDVPREQRMEQMTNLMKDTDEKMKGLLTSSQYVTYEAWRQESGRIMGGPGGRVRVGGGTQPGGGGATR